jgi:hypothetical protein
VTYFFDENISYRHANMLRALREEVVHISKARGFRRSDPDTVWMPKVAAEGWIAVTLFAQAPSLICELFGHEHARGSIAGTFDDPAVRLARIGEGFSFAEGDG